VRAKLTRLTKWAGLIEGGLIEVEDDRGRRVLCSVHRGRFYCPCPVHSGDGGWAFDKSPRPDCEHIRFLKGILKEVER